MFELPVQPQGLSLARLTICGGTQSLSFTFRFRLCSRNMVLSVVLCVLAIGSVVVQAAEDKELVHVVVVRTLARFFPFVRLCEICQTALWMLTTVHSLSCFGAMSAYLRMNRECLKIPRTCSGIRRENNYGGKCRLSTKLNFCSTHFRFLVMTTDHANP